MSDIHIDQQVLSELQDVMEGQYPILLQAFLKDSELRLEQLRNARNAEELGLVAHSFKGSSSNMGAICLAELCRKLEEQIAHRSFSGIEELLVQIEHEFEAVRRLYRAEWACLQVE